jgi:hypothetical protein
MTVVYGKAPDRPGKSQNRLLSSNVLALTIDAEGGTVRRKFRKNCHLAEEYLGESFLLNTRRRRGPGPRPLSEFERVPSKKQDR